MTRTLQILIAEDDPGDLGLLVHALGQAGFLFEYQAVSTEAAYLEHLHPGLDIILSDYHMPQFGGNRALELLRDSGLDIPLIIISGALGEVEAVDVIKQGAADYVLKSRLSRVGPAVSQAISQARLRKERHIADEALRESEERFRQLAENIHEVFWLTSIAERRMLYVSPGYERIWGRPCAELYRCLHSWADAIHPDDRAAVFDTALDRQKQGLYDEEYRIIRPDGSIRWIRDHAFPVMDAAGEVVRIAGVARDITEQREAESALRLFRSLVDQSDDTFEVIHPETGRFLDVNARGPAELGCTREEYLALRVFDIDPTIDAAGWARIVERLRTAGTLSAESAHQRVDGTTFPIEINAKYVRLERDYIIAGIRNITARREAEKVLGESERRFREMLENVEMIAMTLDREGRVTFCNDYLLELTGWSREEVIGADWFAKFVPCNPEVREIYFATMAEGTLPAHHENAIVTQHGQLRDIVWNNTMLRGAAGQVVGSASLGEDVTERSRAESRIREQAAMLDRTHDAIIVRGFHDRRIRFWSRGAERLYGWTVVEALGRDLGELIGEDAATPDEIRDALLATEERRGDTVHRTKDGRKLTMHTRETLVRDDSGHPKSVLAISTDVTGQKELEARFLRAQRMESIGTLASGVAHDLNNILAPILMSVPLLRRPLSEEKRNDIITAIEVSAERGADIVKQVLTFGRGLEGERIPLQVTVLIKEIVKIVRQTFPRNITIKTSNAADVWRVAGDATQLHQVLLNLCVNARDAMPDGGELTMGVRNFDVDASYASMIPDARTGPHVLLRVGDTGTGMPPEVVERIFDPFFTTKGVGQGTGLGLSTVLGIVKSHGGFLHVKTEPGQGTTFEVYLPASVEQTAPPADAVGEPVPMGTGELILVVDDEASVRDSVRLVLETNGYRVVTATDGIDALSTFATRSRDFALVLTDLMMPAMEGAALIRALRTIAPAIPIVASTGLGEKAQLDQLTAFGVEHVLHKPYGGESLLRTIHGILGQVPGAK